MSEKLVCTTRSLEPRSLLFIFVYLVFYLRPAPIGTCSVQAQSRSTAACDELQVCRSDRHGLVLHSSVVSHIVPRGLAARSWRATRMGPFGSATSPQQVIQKLTRAEVLLSQYRLCKAT